MEKINEKVLDVKSPTEIDWQDIPITVRELRILKHTLGVDRYDLTGGRCPKYFYRNYFLAGDEKHNDCEQLNSLEKKGLMLSRADTIGLCFFVTELGIKLARETVGSLLQCECGKDILPIETEGKCGNCWFADGECPTCHGEVCP